MPPTAQKKSGAFFTPDHVAATLTQWVAPSEEDRLLDPSCGDGQFLVHHANSVGVEQDADSAAQAAIRAPKAQVHHSDFFSWAAKTQERFEALVGNPPFIRYQLFNGQTRTQALEHAARLGAKFSGLSSSWAPYLVVAASLLKPGGRMAFVVPAEIGHAPYALPLLKYLSDNFGLVQVVAVKDKLFPTLSEDCWLLYCEGFGQKTDYILFTATDTFDAIACTRPRSGTLVPLSDMESKWQGRLRPYLLSESQRNAYQLFKSAADTQRMEDLARVSLGYVSGANEFFHLRPSQAQALGIASRFLQVTVRNSKALQGPTLTDADVQTWLKNDECCYLLRITPGATLPKSVRDYLESDEAAAVRTGYKCKNRAVWYCVPDVQTPDFLLTYMAGKKASLIENVAKAACTNSVHCVMPKSAAARDLLKASWESDLTQLSCEIEGHPLGGGMLKLEINEAKRILFTPRLTMRPEILELLASAVKRMRQWRHYA